MCYILDSTDCQDDFSSVGFLVWYERGFVEIPLDRGRHSDPPGSLVVKVIGVGVLVVMVF